jgi:hypothetical protein
MYGGGGGGVARPASQGIGVVDDTRSAEKLSVMDAARGDS